MATHCTELVSLAIDKKLGIDPSSNLHIRTNEPPDDLKLILVNLLCHFAYVEHCAMSRFNLSIFLSICALGLLQPMYFHGGVNIGCYICKPIQSHVPFMQI